MGLFSGLTSALFGGSQKTTVTQQSQNKTTVQATTNITNEVLVDTSPLAKVFAQLGITMQAGQEAEAQATLAGALVNAQVAKTAEEKKLKAFNETVNRIIEVVSWIGGGALILGGLFWYKKRRRK